MAFRYCDTCGTNLEEPTPDEDLHYGQVCPYCDRRQPQFYDSSDWIILLYERVVELEKEVGYLKRLSR